MSEAVIAALVLLALFQLKHLIADFILQSEYILRNRRHYGHPGGLLHVGIHAVGTVLVLAVFGLPAFPALAFLLIAEALVHYHIDWAKDNIVAHRSLTPQDAGFWYVTGTDQGLHQLTYIAMVGWWATQVAG